VVADDLAASAPSRFEWLLHAPQGSLAHAGGSFVVSRGRVRLWVRWLRPVDVAANVVSRPTGSNGFDPTDCLVVEKDGAEGFPALAVLAVGDDREAAPRISLEERRLRIERGPRRWSLTVRPTGGRLSDPLIDVAASKR
jgi:hypothetical protein